jgi:hypothetical protein
MQCGESDFACELQRIIQWTFSEQVWAWLWQVTKDVAALVGVALAFLKWHERREAVIFGRLRNLLSEQSALTRDALRKVVTLIMRPEPGDGARLPLFAERPLVSLFRRRHWTPVLSFSGPLTSADRKLKRLHSRLKKRDDAANDYRGFINEQRFAAYMLEGAIASGRTERTTNDNRLSQLHRKALESFDSALRVPGKEADLDALELKGLLLRRLGQTNSGGSGGAMQTFERLDREARQQLKALGSVSIARQKQLRFVLARAARYRAELLHSQYPASATGRDILSGIEPMLNDRIAPTGQELLDRARLFEVHACIRAALNQAASQGIGPETLQRLSAAERDYNALKDDCNPKNLDWPYRISRAITRLFRRDGAKWLLREAIYGLERVDRIRNGHGCPICKGALLAQPAGIPPIPPQPTQPRSATPNQ